MLEARLIFVMVKLVGKPAISKSGFTVLSSFWVFFSSIKLTFLFLPPPQQDTADAEIWVFLCLESRAIQATS